MRVYQHPNNILSIMIIIIVSLFNFFNPNIKKDFNTIDNDEDDIILLENKKILRSKNDKNEKYLSNDQDENEEYNAVNTQGSLRSRKRNKEEKVSPERNKEINNESNNELNKELTIELKNYENKCNELQNKINELKNKLNEAIKSSSNVSKLIEEMNYKNQFAINLYNSIFEDNTKDVIILGPSLSSIPKIYNSYYMQIILKYKSVNQIYSSIKFILEKYSNINDITIDVDFNPKKI